MKNKVTEFYRTTTHRLLPTPGHTLFMLLIIAVLLWANRVGVVPLRAAELTAVSTNTIAYQGRLVDSAGLPLNGSYGIAFRLYAAETGGEALWEEQRASVSVRDGLFGVLLGSIMPLSRSIFADNDTLYLGMEVSGDGEMSPRIQLSSMPYAMQALGISSGGGEIPPGIIALWSGALADIPDGWSLCDGTNGTPDLTNHFVLSVMDSSTEPGDTGGSHNIDLRHVHRVKGWTGYEDRTRSDIDWGDKENVADDNHRHYINFDSQGASSTAAVPLKFGAVDIRPKYYTMAFIMKD